MNAIKLLAYPDLVRGLPSLSFKIDELCKSCAKRKKTKGSLKLVKVISTSRPVKLLHIDFCGPMRVKIS